MKTMKCYLGEDVKLVVSIRDRVVLKTLTESLKQIKGNICVDKAPTGYLERELAEWLEALLAS